MKLLDLTLESAYANVALDEALLESAEQSGSADDVLRLWEPSSTAVVIGRSSIVAHEVQLDYCQQNKIPIVRRPSGGAAIVTGPGCLMYAVILSITRWPELTMLDAAHRMILQRNAAALQSVGIGAYRHGTSDLVVGNRKISGNSMRRKRDWVLYHGTFLYGLSAELIERCLRLAPRQPEYRRGRSHAEFVANVSVGASDLKNALIATWKADESLVTWPAEQTDRLLAERYLLDTWHFGR